MIIMSLPQVYGYDVIEKVGVGSFSVVYKARSKTSTSKDALFAIKCIDKRYQKTSFADSVVKEITILKFLKHEYIVKLIDFMWDPKYIFIITEYCDEGDLSHYIRKKHKLAESLVKMFMQQLALALKFLNSHNICHMDLKPQNLLLSSKPKLKLKLADFGLSQIISSDNAEQCRFAGSLLYMAPEKLLNQKFDARVDLWSVGIIMYECLFGRPPFTNLNTKAIFEIMLKRTPIELPKYSIISKQCVNLLTGLLKYDPNERISFKEFFNHEFLDLIHMPTEENYLTAVNLIQEAINLDQKKKFDEALPRYREAVKHLEGFIPCETDLNKQAMLNLRFNEYTKRANTLEELLKGNTTIPSSSCQPLPLTGIQYNMLCELSAMTPHIATGLDIGTMGELYLAEGKKNIALEKLTAALEILIPMLANEPAGARKEMLHSQVQKWLHMAESLKKHFSHSEH